VKKSRPKQVILLGAGASKASEFTLPTMQGFFTGDRLERYPPLKKFLCGYYSEPDPTKYNLEDVLAYLDLSRNRLPLWDRRYKPAYHDSVYFSVLDYVQETLRIPEDKTCERHKNLFARLDRRDTVISLNYDLVADQSMAAVDGDQGMSKPEQRLTKSLMLLDDLPTWAGTRVTLTPAEREWGFYLKLHGSLDWLRCSNPQCPNRNIIRPLRFLGSGHGQEAGEPCRACGSTVEVFIIPPVATKRIEDRGRLAFIWNLALRELRDASHWIIFGLSFAPTDFNLKWLVKQALEMSDQENNRVLSIVNPSDNDQSAIASLVKRDNVEVRPFEGIEAFLSDTEPISTARAG
jgi:hypothetical protein